MRLTWKKKQTNKQQQQLTKYLFLSKHITNEIRGSGSRGGGGGKLTCDLFDRNSMIPLFLNKVVAIYIHGDKMTYNFRMARAILPAQVGIGNC